MAGFVRLQEITTKYDSSHLVDFNFIQPESPTSVRRPATIHCDVKPNHTLLGTRRTRILARHGEGGCQASFSASDVHET